MDPRNTFYRERDAIYAALARGETPYGGLENAVNSVYNTYGRDSGVSYQEVAGIIREAFDAAAPPPSNRGGYAAPAITANLSDKIASLNSMYDLVYSDLRDLTQARRGQLEENYGGQQKNLTGQYEDTARQLPLQYAAQGIGNSSYYAKAAGSASDQFQRSSEELQRDKMSKMADLGRAYEMQLQPLQASQAAYNQGPRSITGSQADVQGAMSQYDKALQDLGGQRAGLKTDPQYAQTLQGIAPAQNTGVDLLKKQLGDLAVSSVPNFAKQTIGKDLIKKAGQDESFYTDYFDKLRQEQILGG